MGVEENKPAGWYEDPYSSERLRFWDGSRWTTEAVSKSEKNPDAAVKKDWDPRTPEQMRQDEWADTFPAWDVAVPRSGEPPLDLRGGWQGVDAQLGARFIARGMPGRSYLVWILLVLILALVLFLFGPFAFIFVMVVTGVFALGRWVWLRRRLRSSP